MEAVVHTLDSTIQDLFVCGVCKLAFTELDLFLRHKDTDCFRSSLHSAPQTTCFSTFNDATAQDISTHSANENAFARTVSTMENHNQNEVGTRLFQFRCSTCDKVFSKLKALAVHAKTHNDKLYQCNVCGRCFGQNAHLQRHELSHKVWPNGLNNTTPKCEADSMGYLCTFCNTTFPKYRQFKIHLKSHTMFKKYKCIQNNCNGLFDTQAMLFKHVAIAHETVLYVCHICYQEYDSLEKIATHQNNHNKCVKGDDKNAISKFKCSKCDAVFSKQEKLTHHLAIEDHMKSCVHCGKTFASEKRLRHHLKIHIKIKQYECNICQKSFNMKKYLTAHMLKHGDRKFACNKCNSKFKRQDLLQRHSKIHQSKNIMKCPFQNSLKCKKVFNRTDKLNAHIKCHTQQLTGEANKNKPNKNKTSTMELLIIPIANKDVIV